VTINAQGRRHYPAIDIEPAGAEILAIVEGRDLCEKCCILLDHLIRLHVFGDESSPPGGQSEIPVDGQRGISQNEL
jgi:hypothetical protein